MDLLGLALFLLRLSQWYSWRGILTSRCWNSWIFARHRLDYNITIRARFGTTVCALVKAGLGIAVIDQFTVAHGGYPGIELLKIIEPTRFDTYVAVKRGAPLSLHIEHFIDCLRSEMRAVGPAKTASRKPDSKPHKK